MTEAALPPGLSDVCDAAEPVTRRFTAAGHGLYLVGGVVRDHLAGRPGDDHDLDATTDARPGRIKALVAPVADAVWTQGERFGTIGCRIGDHIWEITTHRAESYEQGSRKPEVTFGDRVEDDLARRDFTVNAMAVDLSTRSLVDPHGGSADLVARVLRTPLDPHVSFSEDPLRMLRAARFHAGYDLEPVPELIAAIRGMTDRMAIVSTERIRDELQKLWLVADPTPGLRLLETTGLLERVLPPLGASVDTVGRRVAAVPRDPAMRWAALFLDSGVAAADLRALVFSGRLAAEVIWLVSSPLARSVPDPSPGAVRRAAAQAPSGRRLEDLLVFVEAIGEAEGRDPAAVRSWRAALAELRRAEPDLDDPSPLLGGDEVGEALGLVPGPEIGVAMAWLRDLRFDEGPMDPAQAAARLCSWWATRGG